MNREELARQWNMHADGYNQWESTCSEEKVEWAYKLLNASAACRKRKDCKHLIVKRRLEVVRNKYHRIWRQYIISVHQCIQC